MNGFKTMPKAKEKPPVKVVINGGNCPHIKGIAIMPGTGPSELRDAKVGIPASRLSEYIFREGGPALGLSHTASLQRICDALDAYLADGRMPAKAKLVSLDVAIQNVKGDILGKYRNARIRLGPSSSYLDYQVSETLLMAADALSYYVEPNGDKVVVRFLQGPNSESQIKVEGHAKMQMPDEVKGAVSALLGLVGAEIVPNGNSYAISDPRGTSNRYYDDTE